MLSNLTQLALCIGLACPRKLNDFNQQTNKLVFCIYIAFSFIRLIITNCNQPLLHDLKSQKCVLTGGVVISMCFHQEEWKRWTALRQRRASTSIGGQLVGLPEYQCNVYS